MRYFGFLMQLLVLGCILPNRRAEFSNQQLASEIVELKREMQSLKTEVESLKTGQYFKQNLVGFTAFEAYQEGRVYSSGQKIEFETELYDADNNYDASMFTCPATGMYVFSVSLMGYHERGGSFTIQVGTTETGGFHTHGAGGGNMGSTTVVVHCAQNTQVYVKCLDGECQPWGLFETTKTAAFTGALLSLSVL